ncbi:hypothetical protein ACFLQI_01335 [Candidatus Undinarchaeota archaeon]
MPRGDGTGPRWGCGRGCGKPNSSGRFFGRQPTEEDEKQSLLKEKEYIDNRLKELE